MCPTFGEIDVDLISYTFCQILTSKSGNKVTGGSILWIHPHRQFLMDGADYSGFKITGVPQNPPHENSRMEKVCFIFILPYEKCATFDILARSKKVPLSQIVHTSSK